MKKKDILQSKETRQKEKKVFYKARKHVIKRENTEWLALLIYLIWRIWEGMLM